MIYQKTINQKVCIEGVGVHTGQKSIVTLHPAEEDSGIIFQDSKDPDKSSNNPSTCPSGVLRANGDKKIKIGEILQKDSSFSTIIQKDNFVVSTIEHLMASISGLGIDNLIIEVSGNEIPIMDGSAFPFAQSILDAGIKSQTQPKKFLTPKEIIIFQEEDKAIEIRPISLSTPKGHVEEFQIGQNITHFSYSIDFPHPLVRNKKLEIELNEENFVKEIAPARTFGFLKQLPMLRTHGLARGTNLGNTVVVGEYDYLNTLRFPDEFVRHKLLDLIGDLSLLGHQISGKITAHKTGHSFNRKVVEHYLNNPDKWKLTKIARQQPD